MTHQYIIVQMSDKVKPAWNMQQSDVDGELWLFQEFFKGL